MDYENLDFPQAVETLAGSAGLEVPREPVRGGRRAPANQQQQTLYALMEQAATYYQQQLRSTRRPSGRWTT